MQEQSSGEPEPHRARHHRRTVLAAGATATALAVAGTAAVIASRSGPHQETVRRSLGAAAAPSRIGLRKVERVFSRARGRDVDLVTILPFRHPPAGLPMSLLLHGRKGTARGIAWPSFGRALHRDAEDERITPFGFVAVDGGDNYWHQVRPGDDPMAMLMEEVPVWLTERGLGGTDGLPFAATGTSMGGFGALLYARRRAERRRPLPVAAVVAPALMTRWEMMRTRNVYDSRRAWAADDPLRNLETLRGVRIGVWCGVEDDFIDGVRRFIRSTDPEYAYLGPGGHREIFNEYVAADVVRFVGTRVPDRASALAGSR